MKRKTLEWCYQQFMMCYFRPTDKRAPEYREYQEASQDFFATFTQEQDQLYFRFEAAKNALGALQQEQFFYDVFLFSRELMR